MKIGADQTLTTVAARLIWLGVVPSLSKYLNNNYI